LHHWVVREKESRLQEEKGMIGSQLLIIIRDLIVASDDFRIVNIQAKEELRNLIRSMEQI